MPSERAASNATDDGNLAVPRFPHHRADHHDHMDGADIVVDRFHVMWRQSSPSNLLERKVYFNWLDRFLRNMGADLVYFTCPSYLALVTAQFSYLITIWDLAHLDEVDFPEVRSGGEFERREQIYQHALKKATGIIVDSQAGHENVVRRYGVDTERVHVIPCSPAVGALLPEHELGHPERFVDIKAKYGLDCDYIYCPAQFWPHKNHVYLLRGLRSLEDRFGIRVGAVFSGRALGNLAHVQSVAADLRLTDGICFAGFVADREVACLYRQALALVMPTCFGPANLPPDEAFQLRVPVLYSDLKNSREQVGDAGLLIDLLNPDTMADALQKLISDPDLRQVLIERGRGRIEALTDDRRLSMRKDALGAFRVRSMCWVALYMDREIATGTRCSRRRRLTSENPGSPARLQLRQGNLANASRGMNRADSCFFGPNRTYVPRTVRESMQ